MKRDHDLGGIQPFSLSGRQVIDCCRVTAEMLVGLVCDWSNQTMSEVNNLVITLLFVF